MTIEEKAKAYDEAIERGKQIQTTPYTAHWDIMKEVAEHLLPELKESEDERIIKDIVTYLKSDIANKGYRDKIIESWIDWLEKQCSQIPANSAKTCKDVQKPIKEHDACDFCEDRYGCVNPCPTKLIEEQKPVDFSDLRTWKYIVDAVWTEKEGIGQYLDSPFTEEVAKKLQKRFGKIEQKPAETEKGVKGNDREIPFDAWSEEDDEHLGRILKELENQRQRPFNRPYLDKIESDYNWLKSLKNRYTWKPSGEQMEFLYKYAEQNNYDGRVLTSLYQDLKKLKEE